jgi:predicted ester cyclase
MSVEEENKALIDRLRQAINGRDFEAFGEFCAPDNAQELKESIAEIRQAFPDYHNNTGIQKAEGDFVARQFVAYGTHLGEFMGIAPTGEKVTFTGVLMDRLVDGKIVESWAGVDADELMLQLATREARKRERADFSRWCTIQQCNHHFPRPAPTLQYKITGALAVGLRPEVDH